MTTSELILAIIGSVGGVSVLVLGLSAWLGKVWADRMVENQKHINSKEIELLRSRLELEQQVLSRNENAKFKLYIEVWEHLQEVKFVGDKLWVRASRQNLEAFIVALHNASVAMDKGKLIISDKNYKSLKKLIGKFENYYFGKERLIELKSDRSRDSVFREWSEGELTRQVQQNDSYRKEYEALLDSIAVEFKHQLKLVA